MPQGGSCVVLAAVARTQVDGHPGMTSRRSRPPPVCRRDGPNALRPATSVRLSSDVLGFLLQGFLKRVEAEQRTLYPHWKLRDPLQRSEVTE